MGTKQTKIDKLRKDVAACQRCVLHETRTNTVPGEGALDADIVFIGEAPGRNEDLKGEPFVGRAGDVLSRLLQSIGLERKDIYICNILKCRPPGNRNPLADEIRSCVGSLDLQLKIIQPKVIATLGNFATTYILDKFALPPAKISQVAGKVLKAKAPFGDIYIVPLFHPAVVTYNAQKIDLLITHMRAFSTLLNLHEANP